MIQTRKIKCCYTNATIRWTAHFNTAETVLKWSLRFVLDLMWQMLDVSLDPARLKPQMNEPTSACLVWVDAPVLSVLTGNVCHGPPENQHLKDSCWRSAPVLCLLNLSVISRADLSLLSNKDAASRAEIKKEKNLLNHCKPGSLMLQLGWTIKRRLCAD